MFRRKLPVRSRDFCLQKLVYQQSTWSLRNTKSSFRCDCTRLDLTGNTRKEQKRLSKSIFCHLSGTTHLVVPDDSDVRRRAAGAAVVSNVVVFGAGDPAGGEEERVELLAQGLPSHELDRQLPADRQRETRQSLLFFSPPILCFPQSPSLVVSPSKMKPLICPFCSAMF